MPTFTDVRNEITKALESSQVPKPLYAVAGVGDLAVEKLRDLHLDQRLAGLGDGARALPGRVQHAQADVQGRVRELPGTVVDAALAASGRATGLYEDLSTRGKKLVDGISVQRPVTITDAPAPANGTAAKKPSSAGGTATATKPAAKKSAPAKSGAKKTTSGSTSKSTKASTAKSGQKKS